MEREVSQIPAGSLEKFCRRRAALLAGEIESNAGSRLNLRLDDGVADDPCKDEGWSVERQVTMANWRDYCGVGGASLRDG